MVEPEQITLPSYKYPYVTDLDRGRMCVCVCVCVCVLCVCGGGRKADRRLDQPRTMNYSFWRNAHHAAQGDKVGTPRVITNK
jgi:hypothetical protein